ncbi:hypothetical protein LCGC14_2690660, partial [marine sediment metagenome]
LSGRYLRWLFSAASPGSLYFSEAEQMGKSKIEWCTDTWNPTTGCSRVSAGCDNCYAIRMANRIQATGNAAYTATVKRRPLGHALNHPHQRLDWTGIIHTLPERLDQPIRWRKPRRIFVGSMSDLFHPSIPFEFIDRVWAVMTVANGTRS